MTIFYECDKKEMFYLLFKKLHSLFVNVCKCIIFTNIHQYFMNLIKYNETHKSYLTLTTKSVKFLIYIMLLHLQKIHNSYALQIKKFARMILVISSVNQMKKWSCNFNKNTCFEKKNRINRKAVRKLWKKIFTSGAFKHKVSSARVAVVAVHANATIMP